ncbi:hypothetical protein OS493_014374 [Desmophyllum pertusum]|uniref:Uncharacterized protein n=1 Tax=Desmophyllum pertusum TaxID=174260 RepID=A0A9X0CMU6_9CNID|nr:hypothetical protein OS493_014374 [Desmophyllum pertusum]
MMIYTFVVLLLLGFTNAQDSPAVNVTAAPPQPPVAANVTVAPAATDASTAAPAENATVAPAATDASTAAPAETTEPQLRHQLRHQLYRLQHHRQTP